MSPPTRGTRRGVGAVIRGVLLSLLFAFSVGLAIGTWLRCEMEKPIGYLAGATRAIGGRAALRIESPAPHTGGKSVATRRRARPRHTAAY